MKKLAALLCATSALAIGAAQAGEIEGRVTDHSGTIALDGATVRVVETGQTVTTKGIAVCELPVFALKTQTTAPVASVSETIHRSQY